MTISEKVSRLRQLMAKHGIQAYLIPSSDPHQSEYVAAHWQSRAWASGFTGSAGLLVVTPDHAGLWADSRYFLQAEQQLAGTPFVLQKQQIPHSPEHIQWLVDHLKAGDTVGCDGALFSVNQIKSLGNRLEKKAIQLDHSLDLITPIWKGRPNIPRNEIFEHDVLYAGLTRSEKLGQVREEMKKTGAQYHLVTTLDDIAWVLNIRGSDVDYNPVAICYLLIGKEQAYLFIDEDKVPESIAAQLQKDKVIIRPYEGVVDFIKDISVAERILVAESSMNINLFEAIPGRQRINGKNPIRTLKAIKNPTEISHIREVMVKDGVALTHLYRWLEKEVQQRSIPEVEVAEQLIQFRKAQGDYFGESFSAIVGYNGNGAIVHYRPEPETCADIKPEGILLLDSGGQYQNGTTDITRTVPLGMPTAEQKRDYTLVLKGHIALATIQFPAGTTGGQLDTLARMFLWRHGLNYGHGTGHGVGFFLNVHEPPQGFAASVVTSRGSTVFQPGMFTSNEPGFYKTDEYGIRIENLVLCVESEDQGFGPFLKFETLTLFPIDKSLIATDLLTKEEKNWLNDYHRQVFAKLSPHLDEEATAWLKDKCEAL